MVIVDRSGCRYASDSSWGAPPRGCSAAVGASIRSRHRTVVRLISDQKRVREAVDAWREEKPRQRGRRHRVAIEIAGESRWAVWSRMLAPLPVADAANASTILDERAAADRFVSPSGSDDLAHATAFSRGAPSKTNRSSGSAESLR